jgi:nucleoside-diphosphate-sugar epimerase
MKPVVIVGCGYTGSRVAARLLEEEVEVHATSRDPSRLRELAMLGAHVSRLDVTDAGAMREWVSEVPRGAAVLLSVPTLRLDDRVFDPTPRLVEALDDRPSRVVYLSTTGVYGSAREVDESTPVDPRTERQRLRVAAEQAVAAGPWSSLILRPAAIYGPWRGIHQSMREGRYKLLGHGSHYVSRIHVDDLAWHSAAALSSEVEGAYPVADNEPCRSREIAKFCAHLMHLPMPESVSAEEVDETRRSNRRVDGRAIREELEIDLLYPSYHLGIRAAILAE